MPGSTYSNDWGVCVTLCEVCHAAIHGNGNWGWIAKDDIEDEEDLDRKSRWSSRRDMNEEAEWRKREAWGEWVKRLRLAKLSQLIPTRKPGARLRRRRRLSPLERFALLSGLSGKTILDFEAGRREPILFEAKLLATALGISLDQLATEKEPGEGWRILSKEQSHRRALVFRARVPQGGEIEGLSRAARLIWDVVGRADPQP